MKAALAVALLLVLPAATASVPFTLVPGRSTVATSLSATPLALSRGAANTAAIGANATSSSDAMAAGIASPATANSTKVTNALGRDVQARLVVRSASGNVAQCARCDLAFRTGAGTTTQVAIAGVAPLPGAAGPWVTLPAGSSMWIHAVGQGTLIADATVTVRYELEFQPLPVAPGGGLTSRYVSMSMAYTV